MTEQFMRSVGVDAKNSVFKEKKSASVMKPVLLLFTLVFFGSCCYKSYCDIAIQPPQIRVVYRNFTNQELGKVKLYIADSNYQLLDSASNTYYDNVVYIFQGMFGAQAHNFYDYIYISSIAGRRDTISGIKYDQVRGQIKCGNCIFGDNKQNVTRYENIRYDYKGATQNTDSLVIVK